MKLVRFLLFPFAVLYDMITSIRNLLYDRGIFKSTSFKVPIIAVGNLSVGGTGKTPQIEYLIKLLQKDYKVAVLSRGYKRKTNGFILLNKHHSVEDVGDEPLQFFNKFKNIQVAVDANRTSGIKKLLNQKNKPNIILLDDAYQHRKVKAGFYVLLTKYDDLYTDDFLLPTGNLRESRRGTKRANLIVVTKCPNNLTDKEIMGVERKLKTIKNQQVFFSTISYSGTIIGEKEIKTKELADKELVLVTGIASPKSMLEFLDELKVKYHHINFPDHHHFTETDIAKIQSQFEAIYNKNKIVLTTEKDYMRLASKIDGLYYLSIETNFLENSDNFDKEIKEFVKR